MSEMFAPMLRHLFDTRSLWDLYQPEALLYVALVVALVWVAGRIYDRRVPYDVVEQLAHTDNPAVALSYTGFLLGLGLATYGVLTAPGLPNLVHDLADMAGLGVLAMLLLGVGRWLTDRIAFPETDLAAAVKDGNVAAGMVQLGTSVSTGLIVMRAIAVDAEHELVRAVDTLIFFVAAQAAFVLFVWVYERAAKYGVRAEVAAGNPAAGIATALTMVAVALILSYAIAQTGSLVVFAVWFVMSSVLLMGVRWVVDRAILPGHDLDAEIARDKNWGVAFLEGSVAVVVALIVTGAF